MTGNNEHDRLFYILNTNIKRRIFCRISRSRLVSTTLNVHYTSQYVCHVGVIAYSEFKTVKIWGRLW